MRGSRFTDAQIIGVLREADAGAATAELCRGHGISPATFYNGKARVGGMGGGGGGENVAAGVLPPPPQAARKTTENR